MNEGYPVPVHYGLSISAAGPAGDPKTMARLAALAEKAGWDGIFLEDYIVYQGQTETSTYDPWITLAAMAVSTSRIRLGTSVTPISRRRPWKVASEAVTLDHLSGGRMILGVGSGDLQDPGFGAVAEPTDAAVRAERLDEGLEILAGLWRGDVVTLQGRHFQVSGLAMNPRPLQRPRIPIWVGGSWLLPGVRRRVARWDGCCVYRGAPDQPWQDMTAADAAEIRSVVLAEREDLAGFEICFGGRERGEDWDRERDHIGSLAEAGVSWWAEWVKPGESGRVTEAVARGPLRVD